MYGPGSPLSALKHRHVSSTKTGPPTWAHALGPTERNERGVGYEWLHTAAAALLHLSFEISSMVPWISTNSNEQLFSGMIPPRIALTSASFFVLLVMKCNSVGGMVMYRDPEWIVVQAGWKISSSKERQSRQETWLGDFLRHQFIVPSLPLSTAQSRLQIFHPDSKSSLYRVQDGHQWYDGLCNKLISDLECQDIHINRVDH